MSTHSAKLGLQFGGDTAQVLQETGSLGGRLSLTCASLKGVGVMTQGDGQTHWRG